VRKPSMRVKTCAQKNKMGKTLRTPRPAGCILISSRRIWTRPELTASSPTTIGSPSLALSTSPSPRVASG
jgi:hypothetical protein